MRNKSLTQYRKKVDESMKIHVQLYRVFKYCGVFSRMATHKELYDANCCNYEFLAKLRGTEAENILEEIKKFENEFNEKISCFVIDIDDMPNNISINYIRYHTRDEMKMRRRSGRMAINLAFYYGLDFADTMAMYKATACDVLKVITDRNVGYIALLREPRYCGHCFVRNNFNFAVPRDDKIEVEVEEEEEEEVEIEVAEAA